MSDALMILIVVRGTRNTQCLNSHSLSSQSSQRNYPHIDKIGQSFTQKPNARYLPIQSSGECGRAGRRCDRAAQKLREWPVTAYARGIISAVLVSFCLCLFCNLVLQNSHWYFHHSIVAKCIYSLCRLTRDVSVVHNQEFWLALVSTGLAMDAQKIWD